LAAFVFSLVLSAVLAGTIWLLIGSRFKLNGEYAYNDLTNAVLYLLLVAPVTFLFVFFVLG